VDHIISDNHFLYAFVATGHRSGGFNLLAPTDNTAVGTVEPEDLLSYELGYKGSFLDNRVNFASAVYFYDYSDLQVLKSTAQSGVTVAVYENAAEASAWGIETEVIALLTEGLSVSGTYSYNDSEYEDFESLDSNACALGPQQEGRVLDPLCTDDLDLSGNVFPRSPDHKLSLNLTYEWELLALDWRATTSYQYTGEQYTTAFNNDLYDFIDSWDRWDARLSVASPETTWELTAFVKNIADDREETGRARPSTVSGLAASSLTDPRTYGLRFTYNF
ncbi:MAG: TonB-dependent receptor domain-containing protein, partial [Pseudomonadales bacterium]